MIDVYMDDIRPAPDGWMVSRTVADTKLRLEAGIVRRLSLDHDMGACPACEGTGKHVGDMSAPETTFFNWCPHHEDGTALVRWMIEQNIWPQQKPTVHSMNPVGAARMRSMIDRYWPH